MSDEPGPARAPGEAEPSHQPGPPEQARPPEQAGLPMRWHPSPKLRAYVTLVATGLVAALLAGRPEGAVLAAPFVLALAAGMASVRPLRLRAQVAVDRAVLSEGDELAVAATFDAVTDVAGLEVFFLPSAAFNACGPDGGRPRGTRLRAGQTWRVEFPLRAVRWGNNEVGVLYFRARSALGMLESEGQVAVDSKLTIYPGPHALRRLVRSRWANLAAGAQVASVKASGIELAGVRPYMSGDRARDVNWRASARHGGLYTNERHPDRGTDVVLFLDTFDPSVLERAVSAACALAEAYLAQRDRLALVNFGGMVKWLRPGMGLRQRYVVVDALLSAAVVPSAVWKDIDLLPPRLLPPSALVLALTSLSDERSQAAFVDMRKRGIDLVVIEVPAPAPRSSSLGEVGEVAYRLWRLQRALLRDSYTRDGRPRRAVVGGRTACSSARGGGRVATSRQQVAGGGVARDGLRRPRVRSALGTVALAGGAGCWAVALRPSMLGLLAALAGAGVVVVAAGVAARLVVLVTWGVVALGAAYLASQYGRPVSVPVAAGFAALLLAVVEVAWWSAELAVTASWERSAKRWRWGLLAGLGACGFAVALLTGLVGVAGLGAGTAVLGLGSACALGLVGLVVRAVRDLSRP